jgi:hypothetical protein
VLALGFVVAATGEIGAQPLPTPEPGASSALTEKIAIVRLEALGMDAEPVARLEALFRMEVERLAGHPLPTRRQIDKVIRSSRKLRKCGSKNSCLAAIGKRLGVDLVVTGHVAALGDSYTINIKVVEVATGKQRGDAISSEPLRGEPDQLIEAVRMAAYTMLAPAQVRGRIMVLTDLVGAVVELDGEELATTPLRKPIADLEPTTYQLRVTSKGYLPFEEEVRVRFQKTTRVVVSLAPEANDKTPLAPVIIKKRPARKRWYSSTWFYVGAGVTAAIVGGYIGYQLAHDPVIDCNADPSLCGR